MHFTISAIWAPLRALCLLGTPSLAMAKVLCLYGSESGTSKRALQTLSKQWTKESGGKFTIEKIADGNSVAYEEEFTALAKKYDVILVATSSYGEGDPPDNFALFVGSLLRASKDKSSPLTGMQHGVLGFGESVYDTFQNIPRFTDKLLGECGSRRLVMRVEVDGAADYEGSDSDQAPEQQMAKFSKAVLAALKKLPAATSPPVCDWTKPESKLLEKTEAE